MMRIHEIEMFESGYYEALVFKNETYVGHE